MARATAVFIGPPADNADHGGEKVSPAAGSSRTRSVNVSPHTPNRRLGSAVMAANLVARSPPSHRALPFRPGRSDARSRAPDQVAERPRAVLLGPRLQIERLP